MTTLRGNDTPVEHKPPCNITHLLQHHYNITATSLQHHCNTPHVPPAATAPQLTHFPLIKRDNIKSAL
jgi:hypothetical protein